VEHEQPPSDPPEQLFVSGYDAALETDITCRCAEETCPHFCFIAHMPVCGTCIYFARYFCSSVRIDRGDLRISEARGACVTEE